MSTTIVLRSVVGGLWGELAGGNVYLFSVYSNQLKEILFAGDPSAQTKIQAMALASNVGNYVPLAGFFYDSRFGGVFPTLVVGAVFTFVGYFGLYQAANGIKLSYAWLIIFCGMWGHGSSYLDSSAISANVKNMPRHTSLAVGLMKSFYGLSASILTQVGLFVCLLAHVQ